MDTLNALITIVFLLFAYSCGRVIFRRNQKIMPGLADLIIVPGLWVFAFLSSQNLNIVIQSLIALGVGILVSFGFQQQKLRPASEKPGGEESNLLKKMWELWKDFAFRLGNFQARMILGFFYFTVLVPFGFISRVFIDPLHTKIENRQSLWFNFERKNEDIESARRQF